MIVRPKADFKDSGAIFIDARLGSKMTGKIKVASVYFGRVSRSRRRSAQTDPRAYPGLEEIFCFGPAAHFTAEVSRFPSMIVTFSRSCKVEI